MKTDHHRPDRRSLPGAFTDPSQVIGQIAREPVATGAQITSTTLSGGEVGAITDIQVPPGQRAIAVQVDQITGVGTVIQTGDYVDMVVGFTGDKFPVITINPADDSITVVSGINSTSVKLILQGMQVLGTLLPPAEQTSSSSEQRRQRRRHRDRHRPDRSRHRPQRPAADRHPVGHARSRPRSSSSRRWTPRSAWCSAPPTTSSTR